MEGNWRETEGLLNFDLKLDLNLVQQLDLDLDLNLVLNLGMIPNSGPVFQS